MDQRRIPGVSGLLAAALLTAACTSMPSFDREGAVQRVMRESGGRVDREQARCYVDRVLDQVGSGPLQPGAHPTPEQVPRLTSIRVDCVGVTNLGTGVLQVTVTTGELRPGISRPQHLGDDAKLDELYRACEAGSGPACDRLFDIAPLGSDYETMALTCGNRSAEKRCAEKYPDPAAATTTVPATTRP